jgi:hypothetical protein
MEYRMLVFGRALVSILLRALRSRRRFLSSWVLCDFSSFGGMMQRWSLGLGLW